MSSLPTLDAVASFWNRRPCNIRHSQRELGTRDYFDDVEQRRYFVEPHIPPFAKFERWAGKRVLEIGCGIATEGINFARAGADYTGVELSEASLEIARRRFDVFGLKATLALGNAETLATVVPAGSFDLLYSFGVIHHTPDPPRALREARKVIRSDGEFRLMLYAADSWKDAMIEAGLDQPEAQSGCPIAFTYTKPEATTMLEQAGFRVATVEQDHIFPFVIEKYIRYEYELQPWFAAMPTEMFQALKRRFGWHLLITAHPA